MLVFKEREIKCLNRLILQVGIFTGAKLISLANYSKKLYLSLNRKAVYDVCKSMRQRKLFRNKIPKTMDESLAEIFVEEFVKQVIIENE